MTCEFGVCNVGVFGATDTYEGPPDVAINGGFLIPIWPVPGLAGIAAGAQATYIPKEHLLCAGPQAGVEAAKQVSGGVLFSSKGEMSSIAKGWGMNISGIFPWFFGGQVADSLSGKTKPAGGPIVGIPGASGSISYSWCFHVR